MTHEELLEKAKQAIDDVFSDTSVGREKTAESLGVLQGDIEVKLDSLGPGW